MPSWPKLPEPAIPRLAEWSMNPVPQRLPSSIPTNGFPCERTAVASSTVDGCSRRTPSTSPTVAA